MTSDTDKSVKKPQSVEYACDKIGISRATLYDLINSGKLRTYKVGRARRVSDEAITDCVKVLEAETRQAAAS
jgi:excisionase family DNA binding protein